jgi:hypothetical protein
MERHKETKMILFTVQLTILFIDLDEEDIHTQRIFMVTFEESFKEEEWNE